MLKINFAGFCLDEVCMCVFGTLMRTCFMFFQKQNNNNYIYLHVFVCREDGFFHGYLNLAAEILRFGDRFKKLYNVYVW